MYSWSSPLKVCYAAAYLEEVEQLILETAPTALSNGPTVIETQCELITNAIERMEKEDIRSIEPTSAAEDEWDSMIQQMNENTLYPLTNSWWNGGNIPGKKPQNLLHTAGVAVYGAQCKETLDSWAGFTVKY
jgi:hypothetical protein